MSRQGSILAVAIALGLGYGWLTGAFAGFWPGAAAWPGQPPPRLSADGTPLELATFAAGCFWCVESDFDRVDGVIDTRSGYTGGRVPRPSYAQVSSGVTGHAEAVEIRFDPRRVTYASLLEHFWYNVDPFEAHRQFCDRGDQYRPVIFAHSPAQAAIAEASREEIERKLGRPVMVRIERAGPFYEAERYHQDYARTHPIQYRFYRWRCGRDARLEAVWGPRRPR